MSDYACLWERGLRVVQFIMLFFQLIRGYNNRWPCVVMLGKSHACDSLTDCRFRFIFFCYVTFNSQGHIMAGYLQVYESRANCKPPDIGK